MTADEKVDSTSTTSCLVDEAQSLVKLNPDRPILCAWFSFEEMPLFSEMRWRLAYQYKLAKAKEYLDKRYVLHPENKVRKLATPLNDQQAMWYWTKGYAKFKWPF